MSAIDAFVFSTAGGSLFLYSPSRKQFLLCHPLLKYIIEADHSPGKLREWEKRVRASGYFFLQGYGRFTSDEVFHQLKRYRFLASRGYFKSRKLPDWQGRLSPAKVASNLSATKQIIFEVTEDCNLSCRYCAFSKYYVNHGRSTAPMNAKTAGAFLSNMLAARDTTRSQELFISFYGGEPLKNFSLIRDIVNRVIKHYPYPEKVRFNMTSNGTLIRKHLPFLIRHRFDLAISLDGDKYANAYRVFKRTGKPVFDSVMKNLHYIKSGYPDYFGKHISFMTVLHNRNTAEDVYTFFRDQFGKNASMTDISSQNLDAQYADEFREQFLKNNNTPEPEPMLLDEMFMQHPSLKSLADTFTAFSGLVFRSYLHLITGAGDSSGPAHRIPTATCSPFDIRIFLTADGRIMPCEHISRNFFLGSMTDHAMELNPADVAARFNAYLDKLRELCRICYVSETCPDCLFNTQLEQNPVWCRSYIGKDDISGHLGKKMTMVENNYPLYLRIQREGYARI